jgi:NADPH-dependent 2,4-dienoyl-CoA reductase/sulfur reductase-like enzyme/nitrite reductase/ring-hydroxylating ferredoxin subunit
MGHDKADQEGPDLSRGVSIADFRDGKLLGRVGDDEVLLVQADGEIFAIGARCTHYRGPLAEGLIVGKTVRCPWHHACFDLEHGEMARPPAFDAVGSWQVDRRGDRVVVTRQAEPGSGGASRNGKGPASVVIVGGGAAGLAAADTLRREGYSGSITMVSADEDAPYDRPNLSKDYLAGKAPDDWMPLRDADYYKDRRIELLLSTRVTGMDVAARRLTLDRGKAIGYDAMILAVGASPVRLNVPGGNLEHVHYLRSFADCRAIVGALSSAKQAMVVGSSFIGLEVAASLRNRGIEVHVVGVETRPLEKVFGPEVGDFLRSLHEQQGVVFHLGETVTAIDKQAVKLASGTTVGADLVVAGIGVRPALSFLEHAGFALDRGLSVNEYLETNVPNVFAAGDVARWPDPHSGRRIRVEHWVVAERQGQVAARNLLGRRQRFDAVPFFWSQHYDVTFNYVGHAEAWDSIDRDGDLEAHDCTLTFQKGGRTLAVATVGRDLASLRSELALETSVGADATAGADRA